MISTITHSWYAAQVPQPVSMRPMIMAFIVGAAPQTIDPTVKVIIAMTMIYRKLNIAVIFLMSKTTAKLAIE